MNDDLTTLIGVLTIVAVILMVAWGFNSGGSSR